MLDGGLGERGPHAWDGGFVLEVAADLEWKWGERLGNGT